MKKFKRQYLSEQDFDYVFFDHNQPITLSAKSKIKGIILSGGKGNPYEPLNLTSNFVAMFNFNVPILGFCLGHEIIAVAHRGRIKKLADYHGKKELITITKPSDPIFEGLNKKDVSLVKRHSFYVSELPDSIENLGTSETCSTEIIEHRNKPIYGFQSHPEASGADGLLIVRNFLKICGISE
ncbi:glutamine amidotransferase-related protein [Saccharicrinis fermentans]|uniref:glutamine amidotransferase-related protein n=1 Tax=Saccharicrinis fermentans TaxID=982 RepID=UPI0021D354C9|nr:gamma-glutamyl-gamma-aminobutyrate hydrolase family protein [Saccharicrinis fermentans]